MGFRLQITTPPALLKASPQLKCYIPNPKVRTCAQIHMMSGPMFKNEFSEKGSPEIGTGDNMNKEFSISCSFLPIKSFILNQIR